MKNLLIVFLLLGVKPLFAYENADSVKIKSSVIIPQIPLVYSAYARGVVVFTETEMVFKPTQYTQYVKDLVIRKDEIVKVRRGFNVVFFILPFPNKVIVETKDGIKYNFYSYRRKRFIEHLK